MKPARGTLARIFGRVVADGGPLDAALAEMLASHAGDRAVARNIMFDHRVSDARVTALVSLLPTPVTSTALQDAVELYHSTKVRLEATFLDHGLNAENIVAGGAGGVHLVNKDLEIGRVLDLSGMFRVFALARSLGRPAFQTLPDGRSMRLNEWLKLRLSGTSDDVEEFLGQVFDAAWDSHAISPFHPSWVAPWASLEPWLASSPARWQDVAGLCPAGEERYIVLLKYRVRDVGQLARPTQLDAGWYAYHYPSPPNADPPKGGIAMDLDETTTPTKPVSEYIHDEIHHAVSQWKAGGSRIGLASARHGGDLCATRRRHWDLLHTHFTFSPADWIPKET